MTSRMLTTLITPLLTFRAHILPPPYPMGPSGEVDWPRWRLRILDWSSCGNYIDIKRSVECVKYEGSNPTYRWLTRRGLISMCTLFDSMMLVIGVFR